MFADSVVNIPSSVRLSTDRGAGDDRETNITRLRETESQYREFPVGIRRSQCGARVR